MAKIHINNPKQVINGGAKKYYFKVKGLGGPKGDKGDKGDIGATGPQGPQGNAATVSIGSTTTLPVGNDATVTNSGSIYNAVLNFGIPQGPRGPQGATGAKGDKGDKGDQGNPGPQGEKGTNATVYIGTTTTGEPGTQASVYNSGTENNAVLNFTIPRGDVGPSVPLVQETGYSTTKAMSQNATTEALNGKQNTLTAGSNIQISGSTISATDTKYSAGNGITLTGTQFSANTSVLATKNDLGSYYTKTQIDSQMAAKQDDLVAGSNIQIAPDGKTISATDTTYTAGNGLNLNGTEFSADTDVLATKEDLENYYTKTEADNLLAPKLEAEVVTELPTTGAEGKLYLTPKAHTTSTATGNPITATVTEQAGQLESFQLNGDTFQQPSPNPDYPQPIQTVTGEQTVTVEGKNKIKSSTTGSVAWSGTTVTYAGDQIIINKSGNGGIGANSYTNVIYTPLSANQAYTFSVSYKSGEINAGGSNIWDFYIYAVKADGSTSISNRWAASPHLDTTNPSASVTFTPSEDFVGFKLGCYIPGSSSTTTGDVVFNAQLEKGSTATTYAPYSATSYPISLGNIELCKLGDYQDYIYKDGGDWKVHKAMDKHIFDGSESFSLDDTYEGIYQFRWSDTSVIRTADQNATFVLSDRFRGVAFNDSWTKDFVVTVMANRDNPLRFMTSLSSTVEAFKAWLDSNQTTTYFALKTPTDTVITDTTLIAQLEAIRTASLENGTNTITNTATGTNLAGDMEIGYYGFNPTNRYDKFIWLDLNNNYEQIGS